VAQLAVELECLAQAVRDVQRTGSDMGEGCRSTGRGYAIGSVAGNGLAREFGEDGDVDGDLVEEDAEAAANGGAVVARGCKDKAYAGARLEASAERVSWSKRRPRSRVQPGITGTSSSCAMA
jgi:hypothetical protein